MKNTLVVVTDLAGLKAYRVDDDLMHSSPRLELLEEFTNPQMQERLVEKTSDLAGRFPRRTGASQGAAMSDGERHNIQLELRKRGVRKLAGRIDELMRDPQVEQCFLAASREIHHPLLDELSPATRAKIGLNIPADLTKVAKAELLGFFR
jgi:hypothetical protein